MKKVLLFWAVLQMAVVARAGQVTIVKDGRPNATIVVAAIAGSREKWAAAELQRTIEKISGAKLPIHEDGKAVPGIAFNIGKTDSMRESDLPGEALNPESYAITLRDNNIYLEGRYPTATAFAVVSFIEDQLGVRWFAPGADWEYVPAAPMPGMLTVDVKNVVKSPDTSPRLWSTHNFGAEWGAWNLHNKTANSEKAAPWRNFQNNIYKIFPPEKYAETHPEYYPLINGKRVIPLKGDVYWWPCLGNLDVQRVTAEYIHQYFQEHPEADSFSLGMDDVFTMCQCPLCRAMDAHKDDNEKRRFSDRYYKFINIVAKQVKKTDPGKYIGLLVYSSVRALPETVSQIEDNVFGYMTQNSSLWGNEAAKKADMDLTLAWSKRMKHLSRYDYFGFNSVAPRFYPQLMAEEMKFDKRHGLEGMYTEVYTFLPFTAPMIWAFAKLQWDASPDIDVLLNDYYTKMYGAAAPEMQKYFSLLEKCWIEDKPGFNRLVLKDTVQQALVMTPEEVRQAFVLLEAAGKRAQTPMEQKRIGIIRATLQYYSYIPLEYDVAQRLYNAKFSSIADAQKCLNDVNEFGRLITERESFWQQAMKRDDLLGANLRGFDKNRFGLLDMAILENPALPTILRLTDWYRRNQPASSARVAQVIESAFPEGQIRNSMRAYNWVATSQPKSILKNGDFENNAENNVWIAADLDTKNAPYGWGSYNNMRLAKFTKADGRNGGSGFQISTPVYRGGSGRLVQYFKNLTPGGHYMAMAWVKVGPGFNHKGISLGLRLRAGDGWYPTSKGAIMVQTIATQMDEWQQMVVSITLPQDADGLSLQLNATNSEAIFDDVALYEIPDTIKSAS